eukprot:7366781-Pyramimonas_sp.AAC.1
MASFAEYEDLEKRDFYSKEAGALAKRLENLMATANLYNSREVRLPSRATRWLSALDHCLSEVVVGTGCRHWTTGAVG